MLSHAVVSLLLAFTMLAAAALDTMRDLRVETNTDPLSGLLNRRGFERAASEALSRQAAQNLPAALVIADLDHFKVVNDRFGHAIGDRVIVAFAELLRQAAAGNGIAGRLGGEEFAVLLTASDLPAARLFAEGARLSLSQCLDPRCARRAESHGKLWRRRALRRGQPVRIAGSRRQRALQRQARQGATACGSPTSVSQSNLHPATMPLQQHRVRSPAEAEAPSPTCMHLPDARFTHSNWTWFAAWLRSHRNRAGESDHGAKI